MNRNILEDSWANPLVRWYFQNFFCGKSQTIVSQLCLNTYSYSLKCNF